MVGTYIKTIFRNQYTGETEFQVHPLKPCDRAVNGIIICHGRIGVYDAGLAIDMVGEFDSAGVFTVTEDRIATNTLEYSYYIIDYVTQDLSSEQKQRIIQAANNDLLTFVKKKDAINIVMSIIGECENSKKVAKRLCRKLLRLSEKSETDHLLMKYKIPIDRIEKLEKKEITLSQLKKNPYPLLQENGVSFHIADLFAFNETDITEFSLSRLKGAVYDALAVIRQGGNTCCRPEQLIKVVNFRMSKFGVIKTKFSKSLLHLCISQMKQHCGYYSLGNNVYIYINHILEEENICINNIKRLNTCPRMFEYNHGVLEIEKDLGMRFNKEQRAAFRLLKNSGIKILTGPPGSGKTALIKGFIHCFRKNKNGVVHLAATTGMAAKVMAKSCDEGSETVHKMLNVVPYEDTARGKDLNDPVEADLIIVDEVSMLGIQLLSILVQSIKSGSILLLVGDEDQLQSVEYGNVLHDLINSGQIEIARLTEVMRQSGSICENASRVNKGIHDLILDDAFQIINCSSDEDALNYLSRYYSEANSQIISPIKRGIAGTNSLNKQFSDKSQRKLLVYGNREYRVNDKVIMVKTEYDRGYTNGDIGRIVRLSEDGQLEVDFSGKILSLKRSDFMNMDLAYAITVHKSQGSEFDYVHVVLPSNANQMLTRRLLYTAITRAKKKVIVYSVNHSHEYAIDNTGEKKRETKLMDRLRNSIPQPL